MCNQNQAGIDLSQAASNLGNTVDNTQPEAQAQITAGREPQPELSGRDDPLLNELRKQCQLHHSELSSLAGLDLPGAPYQDVWLGPGGAKLASLLPDAMPLSLEQLGAEGDPQEFESCSMCFCWQAQGTSEIKDPTGEDEATITYGNQGLAEGAFDLCNKAPATAEHGTFKHGLLDPSFSFEIYQDYRSRFPAASFTLDGRTGRPKGPFTLNFTIDELFDQGYHAALLETYEVKTEYGTKTQKRLRDYRHGSYVKKEGTYERGRPKLSIRCKLNPCPNPWCHDVWDADVEVVRFGGRGIFKDKTIRALFESFNPPKKKRRYNRWWR